MSRRSVLLAVVSSVLALSACFSSLGLGSASAAASTRSEFKLGFICSCSGPEAALFANQSRVIVAWEDSVNAAGGINGYKVKVYTKDDGGSPTAALQDAKALVQEDHITAMVGESSLADGSFASYMESSGIPVVGGLSPEESFLTNPDFFPSGTQLLAETAGLVFVAKANGATDLGTGYCAESPICAEAGTLVTAISKLAGIQSTPIEVSATAPSYAAPCLQLKSDGVNAFFPAIGAPVAVRFIDACIQQGYKLKVAGEITSTDAQVLDDPSFNGAVMAGVNANPFDSSTPAIRPFQAALKKYAPGALGTESYSLIVPWAGGELFQAAAKAGKLTPSSRPAAIKKALYSLKNETLDGLAPPLNFVPGKPTFIACYFSGEILHERYVSLNGDKPTCLSSAQAAALAKAL